MTPLSAKLLALVAMEEEATGAPWKIVEYGDSDSLVIHDGDSDNRVCFMATHGGSKKSWDAIQANAALIVALRNALPDIEQAAKALDEMTAVLQDARERMVGSSAAMTYLRYRADMALAKARTTLAAEAGNR